MIKPRKPFNRVGIPTGPGIRRAIVSVLCCVSAPALAASAASEGAAGGTGAGDAAGTGSDSAAEFPAENARTWTTDPFAAREPQQGASSAVKRLGVVVNGVNYGSDLVEFQAGRLSIGLGLAETAGLQCDSASAVGRCLLSTKVKFKEGSGDVLIEADADAFAPGTTQVRDENVVPIVPELTAGRAAFLNYDLSLSGNPDTSMSLAGRLHPAYRDGPHAFDADLAFFQSLSDAGSLGGVTSSRARLSNFVYRREWFDDRLRIAVGRSYSRQRGFAGADQFDGIQLERFNVDNQGLLRTSGRRPIEGYSAIPGILQYRVGNDIYGQVPIRAGRFEVGREFVDSFPRGGKLEFVGVDGVPRPVDLPSEFSQGALLFAQGTYDLDVNIGRIDTIEGYRPYFSLGSRYGLTSDISIDGGISLSDKRLGLTASIDLRLPSWLGFANAAVAGQQEWSGDPKISATYELNYANELDGFNVFLNQRWYQNGGYRGIAYRPEAEYGEITQSTRAQFGFSVPIFGDDVTFRVTGERYRYRDIAGTNRYLELGLSRSLGRLGNLDVSGRFGRDQFDNPYSSVFLNWVVPLGSGWGTTLSYVTEKTGNAPSNGRAKASIWGSTAAEGNLGARWQLSADQDGNFDGDATYRSRYGVWTASLSKPHGGSAFGRLSARGSILAAAGDVSLTQAIDSSIIILRAPELSNNAVYLKPSYEARTRFDGDGTAMVQNIPNYREFALQIDDKDLAPGSVLDIRTLKGAVHPNRAYIVNIPVSKIRSVRLYPDLPAAARIGGYANFSDQFAPVEQDGSLYISDLAKAGSAISVIWFDETGEHSCKISLDGIAADKTASDAAVTDVHKIACKVSE